MVSSGTESRISVPILDTAIGASPPGKLSYTIHVTQILPHNQVMQLSVVVGIACHVNLITALQYCSNRICGLL